MNLRELVWVAASRSTIFLLHNALRVCTLQISRQKCGLIAVKVQYVLNLCTSRKIRVKQRAPLLFLFFIVPLEMQQLLQESDPSRKFTHMLQRLCESKIGAYR